LPPTTTLPQGTGRLASPEHDVRELLERLIEQMVDKGILFEDAQREFERQFLARALVRGRGSVSRTASILGIHRNTLARKLAAHGLDRKR
jgi:DNA-binding NtrC family response regulator